MKLSPYKPGHFPEVIAKWSLLGSVFCQDQIVHGGFYVGDDGQTLIIGAVAGFSIEIPCSFGRLDQVPIWRINGRVYDLLSIPRNFDFIRSITPSALSIPIVYTSLNSTTFQCGTFTRGSTEYGSFMKLLVLPGKVIMKWMITSWVILILLCRSWWKFCFWQSNSERTVIGLCSHWKWHHGIVAWHWKLWLNLWNQGFQFRYSHSCLTTRLCFPSWKWNFLHDFLRFLDQWRWSDCELQDHTTGWTWQGMSRHRKHILQHRR